MPIRLAVSGQKKVLGISFRSKKETFVDLAEQLLKIEESEKA